MSSTTAADAACELSDAADTANSCDFGTAAADMAAVRCTEDLTVPLLRSFLFHMVARDVLQ